MAIANNPERAPQDEGDILAVMKLYKNNLIPGIFDSLNKERIYQFADRFGQIEKAQSYFEKTSGVSDRERDFRI